MGAHNLLGGVEMVGIGPCTGVEIIGGPAMAGGDMNTLLNEFAAELMGGMAGFSIDGPGMMPATVAGPTFVGGPAMARGIASGGVHATPANGGTQCRPPMPLNSAPRVGGVQPAA